MTRPLALAVALVLVACGDTGESNVVADPGPTSTAAVTAPRSEPESSDTTAAPDPALEARPIVDPETLGEPPTVRVAGDEDVLELRPWTTCWRSYCADGAPPRDPEEISAQRAVIVEFPVADWQFSATATDRSTACGRTQTVELDPIGPTVFRLDPMGPPGDYTITLTGRGPGGDLFVSFRWQTTTEGVLPTPEASISVLADHDGTVDSYGVAATITGFATTPAEIEASVTVTSAEGASHSIVLSALPECAIGAGGIAFRASIDEGLIAAALGEPPFTYEVDLRLDGVDYVGRATWPDDVDPECRPCVPLEFTPPLPAMTTR